MNAGRLLAWGMIVGAGLAAVCYYGAGDVRHGTYWLAAAVLNLCVTW